MSNYEDSVISKDSKLKLKENFEFQVAELKSKLSAKDLEIMTLKYTIQE
jgi:hypothetical protein